MARLLPDGRPLKKFSKRQLADLLGPSNAEYVEFHDDSDSPVPYFDILLKDLLMTRTHVVIRGSEYPSSFLASFFKAIGHSISHGEDLLDAMQVEQENPSPEPWWQLVPQELAEISSEAGQAKICACYLSSLTTEVKDLVIIGAGSQTVGGLSTDELPKIVPSLKTIVTYDPADEPSEYTVGKTKISVKSDYFHADMEDADKSYIDDIWNKNPVSTHTHGPLLVTKSSRGAAQPFYRGPEKRRYLHPFELPDAHCVSCAYVTHLSGKFSVSPSAIWGLFSRLGARPCHSVPGFKVNNKIFTLRSLLCEKKILDLTSPDDDYMLAYRAAAILLSRGMLQLHRGKIVKGHSNPRVMQFSRFGLSRRTLVSKLPVLDVPTWWLVPPIYVDAYRPHSGLKYGYLQDAYTVVTESLSKINLVAPKRVITTQNLVGIYDKLEEHKNLKLYERKNRDTPSLVIAEIPSASVDSLSLAPAKKKRKAPSASRRDLRPPVQVWKKKKLPVVDTQASAEGTVGS